MSATNESFLDPTVASLTLDPGSVSFFREYESRTEGVAGGPAPEYWGVSPSRYLGELSASCFHLCSLRLPLLLSPHFLGDRLAEGVRAALAARAMRFAPELGGKMLTFGEPRLGAARAECIPELRGRLAVPVECAALLFSPREGSTVFVDVSRVALRGAVLGHVMALATVRFEAESMLGRFMRVRENRWRYGRHDEMALEARDVISCRVKKGWSFLFCFLFFFFFFFFFVFYSFRSWTGRRAGIVDGD